ncbi:unnamed protein product [Protopolystoma xenopodis]|uniref:Uncharacterized protein n=1 Tax=Protopolystoma xenopodis TaxID=117903 RepID=A0A3S4ZUK9_9PLAT|nr:unnamed protein product [Protopolystoma xenopodis]
MKLGKGKSSRGIVGDLLVISFFKNIEWGNFLLPYSPAHRGSLFFCCYAKEIQASKSTSRDLRHPPLAKFNYKAPSKDTLSPSFCASICRSELYLVRHSGISTYRKAEDRIEHPKHGEAVSFVFALLEPAPVVHNNVSTVKPPSYTSGLPLSSTQTVDPATMT